MGGRCAGILGGGGAGGDLKRKREKTGKRERKKCTQAKIFNHKKAKEEGVVDFLHFPYMCSIRRFSCWMWKE